MASRLALAFALAGCTRDNPAFDVSTTDIGQEAEETDESSDVDSSTSEPETTGSSDTETDTETDTGDTGTESDTDVEPMCELEKRPALRLAIQTPINVACPTFLSGRAMRLDLDSAADEPGMVSGFYCEAEGCEQCGEQPWKVGAVGFTPLEELWDALAPIVDNEDLDGLCVGVTVHEPKGIVSGLCTYGAMAIHDGTLDQGPVFLAQIDDADWTPLAQELLGPPAEPEPLDHRCTCADVLGTQPANLDCCEESGLGPAFYSLELGGVELGPGDSQMTQLGMATWEYHLIQAQRLPICEPAGIELSWAMNRIKR